jgi:hypothetical protein
MISLLIRKSDGVNVSEKPPTDRFSLTREGGAYPSTTTNKQNTSSVIELARTHETKTLSPDGNVEG